MTITVNSIQIPHEFVAVCENWHGGQSSMLYAILSTGNLTLQHQNPHGRESDEMRYLQLWRSLNQELSQLVSQVTANQPENDDLAVLERFQFFAERQVAEMEAGL